MIGAADLTVRRGECPVVDGASLSVGPGECVGLIGPNGAGKTTLMRAMLGLLPFSGAAHLAALSPRERALTCAWLPQSREIAWPLPVRELVALGRMPHSAPDKEVVDRALATMGLSSFADRRATDLSGGEQARVLIARALAQDTPFLMADEPIAGLDPAAQIETMTLFQSLAGEGRGVLVALHDLGLAARHCSRLIVLHQGRIAADGPPAEVLQGDVLARIFRISAHYQETDAGPVFQPLSALT